MKYNFLLSRIQILKIPFKLLVLKKKYKFFHIQSYENLRIKLVYRAKNLDFGFLSYFYAILYFHTHIIRQDFIGISIRHLYQLQVFWDHWVCNYPCTSMIKSGDQRDGFEKCYYSSYSLYIFHSFLFSHFQFPLFIFCIIFILSFSFIFTHVFIF